MIVSIQTRQAEVLTGSFFLIVSIQTRQAEVLTGSFFLIVSIQTRQAEVLDLKECSKVSWASPISLSVKIYEL